MTEAAGQRFSGGDNLFDVHQSHIDPAILASC